MTMPTPLKILYLEDDQLDAELALVALRQDGLDAQIERVDAMTDFRTVLETREIDLILADYRVPGVDALQALQLAHQLRPDLPYVFLSGTIPEELAIETLKLGATDYVFKNRMERLAAAVRRALREAEEQARRRQAEEEARMFTFFSEYSNDGHLLFNEETQILYGNKFARDRLGYSQEELRQLTMPDIDTMFPAGRKREFFKQLKEGRAEPYEGLHKRRDGSTFPVELSFAVLEAQGETLMFATCRDITHRKQVEEDLRRSEQEAHALSRSLEQRVTERTSELEEKTLRLRRLAAELTATEQRERKRLAALLHDDLQQLLVAASMQLTSASHRMKDQADRQSIEQAARWLGEATTAARELTHQLRPPALYEDGLVAGLHGLALEFKERYHLHVAIDGGDVKSDLSDDINALLFECVRELLFNAAKHAGVREVSVRVWEDGGYLRIVIRDEGKGFAPDIAKEKPTSSGFGLFSIEERLAAFEGDMKIDSLPGQGTTVRMNLPITPEVSRLPREQANGTSDPRETRTGGRHGCVRLLLVDDHAMVRQGLATLLNDDARLTVAGEAADGIAAIEAMGTHHPDVLLIDVNMPRMNGIEAAREIHRRWPETIIVGLSVQDDETTASAREFRPFRANDRRSMVSPLDQLSSSTDGIDWGRKPGRGIPAYHQLAVTFRPGRRSKVT